MNFYESKFRDSIKGLGIMATTVELKSAIKEMGLLETIEVNYPSRVVSVDKVIEYPDLSSGQMVTKTVRHECRVIMTDEERQVSQKEILYQAVTEEMERNPSFLDTLVKQVKAKSAKSSKNVKKEKK